MFAILSSFSRIKLWAFFRLKLSKWTLLRLQLISLKIWSVLTSFLVLCTNTFGTFCPNIGSFVWQQKNFPNLSTGLSKAVLINLLLKKLSKSIPIRIWLEFFVVWFFWVFTWRKKSFSWIIISTVFAKLFFWINMCGLPYNLKSWQDK